MGRFVLGVTGAIAAGKSTVCRVLAGRGFAVLDVDDVAAQALVAVAPAIAAKVPAMLGPDGRLRQGKDADKEPLFAAMLRDPELRAELERQLRPHVLEQVRAWAEPLRGPGALEAALLFEQGLDALCDATLCVQCPREERQQRALRRASASAKHFAALDAAQWPEERKRARADAVVSTTGSEEALAAAVDAALAAIPGLRSFTLAIHSRVR